MNRAGRVWFTNFPGIGKAIMLMPVLAALEAQFPRLRHFHTASPVYRDHWFLAKSGLKNLAGLSAPDWRRFHPAIWPAVNQFLVENSIDLVVNLRNEGPKYDKGYYSFKTEGLAVPHNVRFLDFDFGAFERRSTPRNLFLDIADLVLPNDAPHSVDCAEWIRSDRRVDNREFVGFGLAASQRNKRWSQKKWRQLAQRLGENSKYRILLFPGISDTEVQEAEEIANGLGGACELVLRQPLASVANLVGTLGCFVSNDTGLLHIATASGVPSIGIYTNTNPAIWSPCAARQFWSFTNANMFKCEHLKPISGNCLHYYDTCPALEKFPDTVDPFEVARRVSDALES
jgi:hypothetical protein